MTSTLIKRLVSPGLLTDSEAAALSDLVSTPIKAHFKIPITPMISVAQEVLKGRLPADAMLTYISAAEKVDADLLLARVVLGDFTLTEFQRLLVMGERRLYTYQQIETILGL